MEMNEKKLTDEELITALNKCSEKTYCEEKCEYRLAEMGSACIPKLMGQALDLIRRLQYGYSSASKASEEWREKYEAVLKDYYAESQHCDEQKDIIEKQKAEIERLTEENDLKRAQVGLLTEQVEYLKNFGDTFLADYQKCEMTNTELQELNAKYYNEAKDLRRKTAELQKQVDKLRTFIDFKTANVMCEKCKQQSEKDTVKEIFILAEDYNCGEKDDIDNFMLALKERYGVEVE